jgi:hypothetical protein
MTSRRGDKGTECGGLSTEESLPAPHRVKDVEVFELH